MKYGFLGCGNMGSAIARCLAQSTRDFVITDRSGKARSLSASLGCLYGSAVEAAGCRRVFLGVKPQAMEDALRPLQPVLQKNKPVLITMAAGLSMEKIQQYAGCVLPVIRIMPNTPVAIGKGVILYCCNDLVEESTLSDFLSDMKHAGTLVSMEEDRIDAACAVSGCGPAFAYLFLDAMAEGAAASGLSKEIALSLAAETLAGAAQMVLSTGRDPIALKNEVCSPGGSTLAGVGVLEQQGFRDTVMDCIAAAYRRNLELGN